MLIVVIVVGLLYALPNLYGEDPAVQITGVRGAAASEQTLIQVQKTLQEDKITPKSVALEEGAILARFDSTDTQLRAREVLMGVLGDQYVVALNLAPATPRWLAAIHAEPMKLGLDLRGGVHFLMEVDMDTALSKLQEQNIDSLRSDLREKGIPYTTVRKEDNYGLSITFRDSSARDEAISYLSKRHQDLVISSQGSNALRAVMTDARLSEAVSTRYSRTSTFCVIVLTNWVLLSRWYNVKVLTASWSNCRVFRIPRVRKKFWAQPRRWSSVW